MSTVKSLKHTIEQLQQENEQLRKQLRTKIVKEFHVAWIAADTLRKEHGFVVPNETPIKTMRFRL